MDTMSVYLNHKGKIMFTHGGINVFTKNTSSGYTAELVERVTTIIEKNNWPLELLVMGREQYSMSFSVLVLGIKYAHTGGHKFAFTVLVVGENGMEHPTVEELISVETNSYSRGSSANDLRSSGLKGPVNRLIRDALSKVDNANINNVPHEYIGGFSMASTFDVTDDKKITLLLSNIGSHLEGHVKSKTAQAGETDVNLVTLRKNAPVAFDTIKITGKALPNTEAYHDLLGNSPFVNFVVEATAVVKEQSMTGNREGLTMPNTLLVSIEGKVDVVPTIVTERYGENYVLSPIVSVGTVMTPGVPTLGSTVFAIFAASLMVTTGSKRYLEPLSIAVNEKRDPGSLKKFIELGAGVADNVDRTVIKISSPEFTGAQRKALMGEIVSGDPIYALDIIDGGTDFPIKVDFLKAGMYASKDPAVVAESDAAAKRIIVAAHIITDGVFPLDWAEPICFEPISRPIGSFKVNGQVLSTEQINAIFIANISGGERAKEVMKTYLRSKMVNMDPFVATLEVLDKIATETTIDNVGYSVIFNPVFLQKLIDSITAISKGSDPLYFEFDNSQMEAKNIYRPLAREYSGRSINLSDFTSHSGKGSAGNRYTRYRV